MPHDVYGPREYPPRTSGCRTKGAWQDEGMEPRRRRAGDGRGDTARKKVRPAAREDGHGPTLPWHWIVKSNANPRGMNRTFVSPRGPARSSSRWAPGASPYPLSRCVPKARLDRRPLPYPRLDSGGTLFPSSPCLPGGPWSQSMPLPRRQAHALDAPGHPRRWVVDEDLGHGNPGGLAEN